MLIEKLFYLMNKLHHYFIAKYSQNLEFNYLIDVGAHKGEFLSSFIKFKNIKKYFCFEPQKDIFNVLKKDYKSRKIKYFNHALGEKKRKLKFISLVYLLHLRCRRLTKNQNILNLKILF